MSTNAVYTGRTVHLIWASAGCPGGANHIILDPYWASDDWHEAARGDGGSYGGTFATITPLSPDETQDSILTRARAAAAEADRIHGRCLRCHYRQR